MKPKVLRSKSSSKSATPLKKLGDSFPEIVSYSTLD